MPFVKESSVFPKYLLPTLPFRRHSRESTSASNQEPQHNEQNRKYLGHNSCIQCGRCAADLCLASQIVSKGFTGRHGRAYLVSARSSHMFSDTRDTLPNTVTHKAAHRQLVTGAHTVSDISCAFCEIVLGWKYVSAEEDSQRYKVGKFILETKRINVSPSWNDDQVQEDDTSGETGTDTARSSDSVEFDSQDEDECEDLFSGVWSPRLAKRRRRYKLGHRKISQD